jgi:RNA polymerase sigma-70 factor (ECF subfamily)
MLRSDALTGDTRDLHGEAFMQAIDPLLPIGYRLAFGLLRNRDEAEDVVQDAALNAWRHRHSFQGGGAVRPWFLAIVANQCRQAVRTRWWSVIRRPDLAFLAQEESEDHSDEVDGLRRGLSKLRDPDRLVLVLRYYLDLSFDDVAATLHISPQAARVRTHRALTRLRPFMDVPGELNDE